MCLKLGRCKLTKYLNQSYEINYHCGIRDLNILGGMILFLNLGKAIAKPSSQVVLSSISKSPESEVIYQLGCKFNDTLEECVRKFSHGNRITL